MLTKKLCIIEGLNKWNSNKQVNNAKDIDVVITASKVSKYRVISGPYFPVFVLNTEIYSVNVHMQSEYSEIRTTNNSIFGQVSCSDTYV